jgi:hypothetical protein
MMAAASEMCAGQVTADATIQKAIHQNNAR